eukprot:803487-Amphidinium_carterae.1
MERHSRLHPCLRLFLKLCLNGGTIVTVYLLEGCGFQKLALGFDSQSSTSTVLHANEIDMCHVLRSYGLQQTILKCFNEVDDRSMSKFLCKASHTFRHCGTNALHLLVDISFDF